jgi:hypothetical protein
MSDDENFVASYAKHLKDVAEANLINKTVVFDALAAAGITSVTVEFDGEGDSGQIGAITAHASEALVPLPTNPVTLHQSSWYNDALPATEKPLSEAVETLCYDYLTQEHDGWENNDGAFGEFTFHVAERRIELDFNGRFSDSTLFSHSF